MPLQDLMKDNWSLPKQVTTLEAELSHWGASTGANPEQKQGSLGMGKIYSRQGIWQASAGKHYQTLTAQQEVTFG